MLWCAMLWFGSGKDKIRLYGVDAPEKTQSCNDSQGQPYACGVLSLEALKERVGSRSVRCEVSTTSSSSSSYRSYCGCAGTHHSAVAPDRVVHGARNARDKEPV
jgi:endonuclease YncB( thermonuclease family)